MINNGHLLRRTRTSSLLVSLHLLRYFCASITSGTTFEPLGRTVASGTTGEAGPGKVGFCLLNELLPEAFRWAKLCRYPFPCFCPAFPEYWEVFCCCCLSCFSLTNQYCNLDSMRDIGISSLALALYQRTNFSILSYGHQQGRENLNAMFRPMLECSLHPNHELKRKLLVIEPRLLGRGACRMFCIGAGAGWNLVQVQVQCRCSRDRILLVGWASTWTVACSCSMSILKTWILSLSSIIYFYSSRKPWSTKHLRQSAKPNVERAQSWLESDCRQ